MFQNNLLNGAILSAILAIVACSPSRGLSADEKPAAKKAPNSPQTPPQAAQKGRPLITVSKEITFITEPVDKDGYVDYLAALNKKESEGATPENNAAVLFVRALGLDWDIPNHRAEYFKMLGIETLPESGDYLTDYSVYFKNKLGRELEEKEDEAYTQAVERPWSPKDIPHLAEWLKANEKPLELLIAGTHRPRCYFPLIIPGDSATLIAVLLPSVQQSRDGARALMARAMMRLQAGQIKEAQADVLACHRLGRLVGSTPFLIGSLVGITIDALAWHGDAALMEHAKFTSKEALAYQAELRKLAPLPVIADQIDQSERFMFLDVATATARTGSVALDEATGINPTSKLVQAVEKILTSSVIVSWDEVLRFGNQQFDKIVAAARKPTNAERQREFKNLDQELMVFRGEVSPTGLLGSFLGGRKSMGKQMGKILCALLVPGLGGASEAENRAHTRVALGQLGFALVAYRADYGKFPERLDLLTPKYIAKVPNDLYTDLPFRYTAQGDGFMLYSVGENGKDDGGRPQESGPQDGDIVLRIPTHTPQQK